MHQLISRDSKGKIRVVEMFAEWNDAEHAFGIYRTTYQYGGKRTEQPAIFVRFDGLFVSPVVRAALIETLKKFGYEVHVVYITLQTVVDTLAQKVAMKAIQTKAHRLYCLKHKNALTAQRMITIRNQAIALYAEDNGLTEDEVISLFLKDPNVIAECKRGAEVAMNEVEMHGVQYQESTNAFMLGADYYYEI